MHDPGILEKNREVSELMRFSFLGIKAFYHREARVLVVCFHNRYAMVFSDMANGGWIAESDKYYPYRRTVNGKGQNACRIQPRKRHTTIYLLTRSIKRRMRQ